MPTSGSEHSGQECNLVRRFEMGVSDWGRTRIKDVCSSARVDRYLPTVVKVQCRDMFAASNVKLRCCSVHSHMTECFLRLKIE